MEKTKEIEALERRLSKMTKEKLNKFIRERMENCSRIISACERLAANEKYRGW